MRGRRRRDRLAQVDRPVLVQAEQALVERLHAVVLAFGDDALDLVRLVGVHDLVEHATRRHEHFDRGRPSAGALLDEPLAHDAAQRPGERHAHLPLLVRREEVDDPVDRVGRADGVQRREHQVAGLGGGERGLHRLDVADLSDEDDVRVLPQHALQRGVEIGGVGSDLTLVDDRALVRVQDLDRVLDRHDVPVVVVVDVIDHRAERRRLARAGRSGDEDETALVVGELADDGRQPERLERRDVALDAPQHEADRAALAHHVHAEAAETGNGIGEVGLGRADELLGALLRHDRERDPLGLHRRDRCEVGPIEPAVDAEERRRAHLDVYVRSAPLYGVAKQLIQVQHWRDLPFERRAFRAGPPSLHGRHRGLGPTGLRSAPAGLRWSVAARELCGEGLNSDRRAGVQPNSAAWRSRAAWTTVCPGPSAVAGSTRSGRPSRVETVAAVESRSASRS